MTEEQEKNEKIAHNAVKVKMALLRQIMIQKNITLLQLEECTGINNGNLSRYFSGRTNPSLINFERICAAIGVNHYFEDKNSKVDFNMAFEKAMNELGRRELPPSN